MGDHDPRVEAFFAKEAPWKAELAALRRILCDCPLHETFKWRGPCYVAHGGNVATLWRMKDRCGLGFFKGVLLEDPGGLLVPPGDNSRSVRVANFTSVAAIDAATGALRALLDAAIRVEAEGRRVAMPKDDLAYPGELTAALDADPALAEAFAALTPGRQRGWVLHVAGAKQAKTRESRIAAAAPRILAGKGMHDR
ncbi:YdeI/OmpD-associated family protein [Acidimangrovimonas sediminis]|uniref:YdeI/OmpD-associated family protein n=1 Tax=Acidimangrovimonas sediminis TaxID=2056283 RepID=UPI000C7FA7A4|nr:YdeI/OmpD-associated family protein [Acidimangrovimonas sediminis]